MALETAGMFSIKSLYRTFIDRGKCCRLANRLWKVCSKVRLFLWLVTKDAILTWPKLQRRERIARAEHMHVVYGGM